MAQSLVRRSPLARVGAAVSGFIAAPASPLPLAILRIGVAAVLLAQAVAVAHNLLDLYGRRGIVQWQVMDSTMPPIVPRLRWLTELLGGFGFTDAAAVQTVFLVYVLALVALLFGYRVRIASVAAWLLQLAMKSSASASIYGVDSFAQIALFYMMVTPIGDALSLDLAAGRTQGGPSAGARLGMRTLQLHLCVMYLACAIEKGSGEDWWNGEAIWSSLQRGDLCSFDMSWLAWNPWIAKLLCWGTLIVEGGYPIFMWPRQTRTLWALGIISLHLGIGIFLRLYSFAALMIVLTGSMFLISPTPGKEFETWFNLGRFVMNRLLPARKLGEETAESVQVAAI